MAPSILYPSHKFSKAENRQIFRLRRFPPLPPPLPAATMTVRRWTNSSRLTEITEPPWPLVVATPSGCFGVPELGVFSIAVCDMENGFVWWRNFADSACTQLTWSSRGGPLGTWCFSAALPLSHLGSHDCGAYAWCAHARIRSLMFPPSASSQLR